MKKIIYGFVFIFIIFCIGILTSYFYVPMNTTIYHKEYDIYAKELDFTEITIGDFQDLVDKIGRFENLEVVKFKDGTVSKYQKNTLEKLYPDVEFVVISYVDIFDQEVREDIESLDFRGKVIDDSIVDKLREFSNLKEVNLYGQSLSLDCMIDLINRYPNITFKWSVDLNGISVDYNVESLDFTGQTINDKETFIKSLKLLPNLKTLDMSYTNFTNEELGNMRELYPNIQIDWVVWLGRWHIKTSDTSFSVLIRQFDYEPLTSNDLHVLKYCTKLEALDLGHQKITDISMIPEYLPNLKILILADNKITDISPISKLDQLVYLELFINQITDISPLSACKKLIDVNLCYNNKLEDITPLYELPNLERIWLVHVPASSNQINELRVRFPNAAIDTVGPGSTDDGWRSHERYFAMIKMYRNPTLPVSEVFTKYYK